MKRTEQEQRAKILTECIKYLEEMKETNESVIVIADSFACTMMDVEGKTDEETAKNQLSTILALITTYLVSITKKTHTPLTALLLPLLIEVAKEEGIKVGEFSAEEFSKEILKNLGEREQILN